MVFWLLVSSKSLAEVFWFLWGRGLPCCLWDCLAGWGLPCVSLWDCWGLLWGLACWGDALNCWDLGASWTSLAGTATGAMAVPSYETSATYPVASEAEYLKSIETC